MTEDEIRLKKFIKGNTWIFAKTYAKTAPHEYVVYDNLDAERQKEYDWFVKQIEEKGVDEKFYRVTLGNTGLTIQKKGWAAY
ncbi:hypothetical protein HY250_02805 [Candidatus Azambacteria bacterium]|nr:hypothetical protein [Candidatus Azambacteria bacterium]